MDTKGIFANIEDKFEYSVIGPVNPFTIDNPDVLIYNTHQLVGLYIPLAKELENPDLLLRRVHMSRLALRSSISSVLLLSEDTPEQFYNNDAITSSFDRVHFFDGDNDLLSYISDDIKPVRRVDKRLRGEVMKRFWGAMDYMDIHSYLRNDYMNIRCRPEIATVASWSRPGYMRRSTYTSYDNSYLITSKRKTKQSFKEGYEDIMSFATMFNYSLSDGYLKRNPYASDIFMYLNLEEPDIIFNRGINLRTMLFLGYLPCTVGSVEEVKFLNDQYYSFRKERKYL